ncbi:MAG: hypothetical protein BWY27_01080 [Bacteroidetes bacterium ADurb.Bin234]|nr:MAG: hypothetical protein BWY27_01080 [Bacteroidetes bacterium ADurb.Bin234]
MTEDEITKQIIGCAIEVHKKLGPGLLESVYEECLQYELLQRNLLVKRQLTLPVVYKDIRMETGYRLDLIVENKVIIEIKSVGAINDVHKAQILTYLKLMGCKVGILINFNVYKLTDGICRLVNKY